MAVHHGRRSCEHAFVSAGATILHADLDSFYASVEQRDDPSLLGRPVIVGGTGTRGVVAAASYEVRKFGVRSAMPMREALSRCPDAICVRPRMSHYQSVSRQIFTVFSAFTPLIEGLSLDEAFLDVTASIAAFGPADLIAAEIKRRVLAETARSPDEIVGRQPCPGPGQENPPSSRP